MKKVLVVFDSTYGNTEKLGREIASGIEETGIAECKVINIDDVEAEDLSVEQAEATQAPEKKL